MENFKRKTLTTQLNVRGVFKLVWDGRSMCLFINFFIILVKTATGYTLFNDTISVEIIPFILKVSSPWLHKILYAARFLGKYNLVRLSIHQSCRENVPEQAQDFVESCYLRSFVVNNVTQLYYIILMARMHTAYSKWRTVFQTGSEVVLNFDTDTHEQRN